MNIILCGPSGAGKTAIIEELLKNNKFKKYTSVTSREMRDYEVNGDDYWFYSKEELLKLIDEKKLFNLVQYKDTYYATIDEYPESVESDKFLLSAILPSRALEYKISNPDNNCIIYIIPPDTETLTKRCGERNVQRLGSDLDNLECAYNFDYSIINDNFEKCIEEIKSCIRNFYITRQGNIEPKHLDNFKSDLKNYIKIRKL